MVHVYVSGAWAQREAVRDVMDQLETAGHSISFDWTTDPGPPSAAHLAHVAERCLQGISAADAFVALITDADYPYSGTFCELGAALALGKAVYMVVSPGLVAQRPPPRWTFVAFFHHPGVQRVASVRALLRALPPPTEEDSSWADG